MSTNYVYPTPRSPVRDHALAVLQCTAKDGDSYERDPDRPCFGLVEPYELAVFVEAITDETPIDEVWLRRVGFEGNSRSLAIRGQNGNRIELRSGETWIINSHCVPRAEYTTRGQLRLLAMALGIALGEGE